MIRRLLAPVFFLLIALNAAAASPLDAPMKTVESLRGLTYLHPIAHQTIDRSQLPAKLREQMMKSMPYAPEEYIAVLRALQLVDGKDSDLLDKMIGLYDQQVLAFYDPLTHVYYSIRDLPKGLDNVGIDAESLRQMVEVHELTHALQDQRFNAGDRERSLMKDDDGELAFHSLLEGEATLVMMSALLEKIGQPIDSLVKSPEALSAMNNADMEKMIDPSTPRYFIDSMKFPYLDGLKLVILGYQRGGWKEIDRMDENPPRSTREVLHPDEYFARLEHGGNTAPFTDAPLIATQHVIAVDRFGEFHWRFLLGAKNAAGWLDDRVQVSEDAACEPTVLTETKWENAERANAFRDAYVAFLGDRGIGAWSRVDGTTVRVAYGADDDLARRFAS